MKRLVILPICGSVLLAACSGGGGGGGVGSTPAPTPSPTPTNATIGDLRYDQIFATSAASTTASINTAQSVTNSASATPSTLQVRYDAASQSYTVEAMGRSQTFLPGDLTTNTGDEAIYTKTNGATRDYLTLVKTPYSSRTPNQYVRLGFWQRNLISPGQQDTSYDAFVYGLATPSGAVPRTGQAGFVTDTIGFVTTPGKTPRAFTGPGSFVVDFALGVFATHSSTDEYDLVTGASVSGGGIEFTGGGHLTGGNAFSGNFTYGGWDGQQSGTIAGQFFGPGAQELGASFAASNAAGAAVTGSITGQSSSSIGPATNLSLVNLVTEQLFYAQESGFQFGAGPVGARVVNTIDGIGQFTLRPDGSASVTGASSGLGFVTLTAANKIAGPANFITYEKTANGLPSRVMLYQPGSANGELALTYASFGVWSGGIAPEYPSATFRLYFPYGIITPRDLLARRTGTASYDGIVYGAGTQSGGALFDVSGSSRFNVDFGAQRFSGSLTLAGKAADGSSAALGSWTFDDRLFSGLPVNTALLRNGVAEVGGNTIKPVFFGPDAEEIGASFLIQSGAADPATALTIAGATVAKRR
jgi:hypothetical protein